MELSAAVSIAEKYGAEHLFNESLDKYTTFGIGGRCDLLIKPNCADCIRELAAACNSGGIPYHVFGRCSNVLISGEGLRGVVILISGAFSSIKTEGETLICDAGASVTSACAKARDAELSGLEFAYGIPGSVGGGLYMNAGAYGGEMKDVVLWCDCLDGGEIKRIYTGDMALSYRKSAFCGTDKIILSVCFGLKKSKKETISAKMSELIKKRRASQPLEYPSAGSTFKRPEGCFAAKLIDDCGLKGYTVGGAQVSEKHSGFVINKGGASFDDVKQIISDIKKRVYEYSGIMLECEMLIVE